MKNLMTQKVVFGVLMALVLAFSVQGVADALTFGTTRTGDLKTMIPGTEFTVSFSVSLKGNTSIKNSDGKLVREDYTTRIDSSGYAVTVVGTTEYRNSTAADSINGYRAKVAGDTGDNNPSATGAHVDSNRNVVDAQGRAVYKDQALTTRAKANPDSKNDALQYHYNQEQIRITISGGGAIKKIGSNLLPSNTTSYDLQETQKWSNGSTKLQSSTITLTLKAPTAPGQYTITVTDITEATLTNNSGDYPNNHTVSTFEMFVFYVWKTEANSRTQTIAGDSRLTSGIISDEEPKIITVGLSDSPFTRVSFEVEGYGTLYEDKNSDNKPDSNPSKKLTAFTDNHGTESVAQVYLQANRGTSKVRAWVYGNNPLTAINNKKTEATYTYKWSSLQKVSGDSPTQIGAVSTQLTNPFIVELKDGGNRALSGEPITFAVTAGGGGLAKDPNFPSALYPANFPTTSTVTTDTNGRANVFLIVGSSAGTNTVTATYGEETRTFTATAQTASNAASIEPVGGDGQRADLDQSLTDPLVVIVKDQNGLPVKDITVRFTTDSGILSFNSIHPGEAPDETPDPADTSRRVTVETDNTGRASVIYNVGDVPGAKHVYATITTYDLENRRVTFKINSGTDTTQPTVTPYLRLSVSPSSGEAGTTGTVTVTAYGENNTALSGVSVNLSGTGITLPSFVTSGSSTSFTFPSSSTSITASALGYRSTSSNITVTQPTQTVSSIAIASGNNQTGEPGESLTSPLKVRITDANGNAVENQPVRFRIASGAGASLSTRGDLTDNDGEAETLLTLGPSTGTYTVEAEATEIDEDVTFTATAVATPTRIEIVSGNNQEGSAGGVLSRPFVVKVTDKRQQPIAGVEVTFRETSNLGKFSGQTSDVAVTDAQGVAESSRMTIVESGYGVLFVKASASASLSVNFKADGGDPPSDLVSISGNNQTAKPEGKLKAPFVVEVLRDDDSPFEGAVVAFKVTGGGGKLSATSVKTDAKGRAQTFLTLGKARGENTVQASTSGVSGRVTFSALAGAEVLVPAGQRPEMYWVNRQDGRLQRLVADRVETIAPNITGITSLAIDTRNGLIYWGRQTGENRGTLQRAGLNGKGVVTLGTSQSFPTSVALNADGTTVYWTSSNGRIKSMPTRGVRKTTLLRKGLPGPTGLVWANDSLYWGESTGRIRRMNLNASGNPVQNLVTGLGVPVSLAAHGGKVYWTETSGDASQLKRANTNGTDVETLKTLTGSKRVWLSIEGSAARLYLTRLNAVERRSLSGRSTKVIVSGLQSPGSIVLGVGSVASTPVVKQPPQQTQPSENNTTYSKYDVNKDGAVNNADTRAVAGAIGQSGAAITHTRTDVDGSGAVDVTDLILVIANLDDDVAAPAIALDVKALDIDFDRVQEQVEALLSSGDRSVAAQRALLYLRHLLASARPSETVLLANYPNPFNPETWIPYHLASATDVHINIYDAQGRLVRALVLGHQTAGYYTSRSRAAYWDGRNAFGEQVASGIYFYQLQTDEMSSMRKMVILK